MRCDCKEGRNNRKPDERVKQLRSLILHKTILIVI